MSSFDFNINIIKCVYQKKVARIKSSTYCCVPMHSTCIIKYKSKFYLIMEALKKFYVFDAKKAGRILETPELWV